MKKINPLFWKSLTFILLLSSLTFVAQKTTLIETKKVKVDTIKKLKIASDPVLIDSIITFKGKFKSFKKTAHASYYADKFHGRRTASGKKYDKTKLTAAHKSLPFGTIVRVTNESNGKSVIVEITDRGPFVRGREIDLSRKAFYTIASSSGAGYIKVTLEVLQK
ncbi:septal ring lytic transglycosylase RlpA family protein [Flavobacterium sp.]|uniref:septal ring lytic transglycosylase RlpA family protein n=1 Tax=Flavobacterium sp. TaxID=239 RepID=UPI00375299D8